MKQRIPVSLRHRWKLVTTCVAFVVVLGLVFGTERIRPIVTSQGAEAEVSTVDIAGTGELFDLSKAHTIALTYDEDEYQELLDAYFNNGEKEWMKADAVIDGVLVEDVGIRLKGNSTLRSLGGQQQAPGGGQFPGGGQAPGGGQMPGGGQLPGGGQMPGGAGPGMGSVSAEQPETLPWLVDFDKYVDGRTFQGHEQLAIRPAGNGTSSLLNEAVALELVEQAGEVSQDYAFTSFTVNGSAASTRLVIEHPDDGYAKSLGNGVLYKALSTSNFTYQGEDPTAYEDDFKQINKVGSQDLQPVINLLKWLNEVTDEQFAAGLADRVDVDSFANYVALQNLLMNFDDMAGPGKNYYLWYDLDTKKIRIITWDLNFAFSGSATAGPRDTISMGGGGMRGGMQGNAAPGGGMRGGNALKEKFLASQAFTEIYENAYRELYTKLFASGTANSTIDTLVQALSRIAEVDATNLRNTIATRTQTLATNEVITD